MIDDTENVSLGRSRSVKIVTQLTRDVVRRIETTRMSLFPERSWHFHMVQNESTAGMSG